MINIVDKEIKSFLLSINGMDENVLSIINEKYSTTISDDLKNGHLTSNVCMVAASILNLNPKDLAKELEQKRKEEEEQRKRREIEAREKLEQDIKNKKEDKARIEKDKEKKKRNNFEIWY